jgi:hypothetical protein
MILAAIAVRLLPDLSVLLVVAPAEHGSLRAHAAMRNLERNTAGTVRGA